jgi:diadenosine tetraphosphatase ApaH/serine/threonine PP2A family protein phosphatase
LKFAILSDIHGNLEAFQAVLDDMNQQELRSILFLGDIVGYGANPRECIDLLRDKTQTIIAGNHDWAVAEKTDTASFNPAARCAIEWTRDQLPLSYRAFLSQLSLKGEEPSFAYAHATPLDPSRWDYIFSSDQALVNLQRMDRPVFFVGHSHIPLAFILQNFACLSVIDNVTEITIEAKGRYLINVGSVGQPRDENPHAAYGIFDSEKRAFSLRRVPYDIGAAQRKILAAGLPPILAERLGFGW